MCSVGDELSLAIVSILNCSYDDCIVVLGVQCSSWVSMNAGTSQRDWLVPMGYEEHESVRSSNLMVSRCRPHTSISIHRKPPPCSFFGLSLSLSLSFCFSLFYHEPSKTSNPTPPKNSPRRGGTPAPPPHHPHNLVEFQYSAEYNLGAPNAADAHDARFWWGLIAYALRFGGAANAPDAHDARFWWGLIAYALRFGGAANAPDAHDARFWWGLIA